MNIQELERLVVEQGREIRTLRSRIDVLEKRAAEASTDTNNNNGGDYEEVTTFVDAAENFLRDYRTGLEVRRRRGDNGKSSEGGGGGRSTMLSSTILTDEAAAASRHRENNVEALERITQGNGKNVEGGDVATEEVVVVGAASPRREVEEEEGKEKEEDGIEKAASPKFTIPKPAKFKIPEPAADSKTAEVDATAAADNRSDTVADNDEPAAVGGNNDDNDNNDNEHRTTVDEEPSPLPEGWIRAVDPSTDAVYYFNEITGRCEWDPPTEEEAADAAIRKNNAVAVESKVPPPQDDLPTRDGAADVGGGGDVGGGATSTIIPETDEPLARQPREEEVEVRGEEAPDAMTNLTSPSAIGGGGDAPPKEEDRWDGILDWVENDETPNATPLLTDDDDDGDERDAPVIDDPPQDRVCVESNDEMVAPTEPSFERYIDGIDHDDDDDAGQINDDDGGGDEAADLSFESLPEGWIEAVDPTSGLTYYYNQATDESRWEHPNESIIEDNDDYVEDDVDAIDGDEYDEYGRPPEEQESSFETPGEAPLPPDVDAIDGDEYDEYGRPPEEQETSSETPGEALPLPPEWIEEVDPSSGETYYYNTATGESDWERPAGTTTASSSNGGAVDIVKEEEGTPPRETPSGANPVIGALSSPLAEEEEEQEEAAAGEEPALTVDGNAAVREAIPSPAASPIALEGETREEQEEEEEGEEAVDVFLTPGGDDDEPAALERPAGPTAASSNNRDVLSPKAAIEDVTPRPLPEGWFEATDEASGSSYYYNPTTGGSSWVRPVVEVASANAPAAAAAAVEDGDVIATAKGRDDAGRLVGETTPVGPEEERNGNAPNPRVATEVGTEEEEGGGKNGAGAGIEDERTPGSLAPTTPGTARSEALPDGWQEAVDPTSGETYYYNEVTGDSSWERPAGEVFFAT